MPLLQYLNGIDAPTTLPGILPPDYAADRAVGGLLDYDMAGLARLAANGRAVDELTDSGALDAYSGINGVEDAEVLRSYLVKTKKAVDNCPQLVQTYVNPEEFSNMLDYVLRYWDTDQRETAVSKMATREQRLIESGKVDIESVNEEGAGGGFFAALWACVRPQTEIAEAMQDALAEYKGKLRRAAAYARANGGKVSAELLNGLSGMEDGERGATSLLYGWDYHAEPGLGGTDGGAQMVGDVDAEDKEYCRRYLRNVYSAMRGRTHDFFADAEEGRQFVAAVGLILANFDNGRLDAIMARLGSDPALCGKLRKKLRKAIKKVGSAVKKAVKATGKAVKTAAKATATAVKKTGQAVAKAAKSVGKAFKKLGKKISRVLKKVVKFLIRFNPLTAAIRGILILAARFNWFNLAARAYPGTMAKATAVGSLKITEEYWGKCNDFYKKFSNVYTKIGGTESKLKSALEKGSKKKLSGGYDVSASKIKELKKDGGSDKEIVAEAEAELQSVEMAKVKAQKNTTAVEDTTVKVGESKTERQEVSVTANEYVTTQATAFYLETDTSKSAATIAKGTKLIVEADAKGVPVCYNDDGTTGGNYYRTEYNGKYGIVLKSCVASSLGGLSGAGRTVSVARLAPRRDGGRAKALVRQVLCRDKTTGQVGRMDKAEVLYDKDGHALGFAFTAAAAIASATATLTGLVSTMLKAFGKGDSKVTKALDVASAATGVAAVGAGVGAAIQAGKAANGATATPTSAGAGKAAAATPQTAQTATTAATTATSKFDDVLSKVGKGISVAQTVAKMATDTAANAKAAAAGQTTSAAAQQADAVETSGTKTTVAAQGGDKRKILIIGGAALGGILLLSLVAGGRRN